VSTIRAREGAVQDSENSVYKMHEKDSEHSEDKMHEGWEMEDGSRVWAVGGRVPPGLSPPSAAEPMQARPALSLSDGERDKGGLRVGQWY